jgi:hypothetical protein
MEINTTKVQFNKLYARLPKTEPPMQGISFLSVNELYGLCRSYASDIENPLWDGSIFILKRDATGTYYGELLAHYAETEGDRVNGCAIAEQQELTNVTERMESIYEALQAKTKELSPTVEWDAVFVSIYRDGFAEANYERNGEEVEVVSVNDTDIRSH